MGHHQLSTIYFRNCLVWDFLQTDRNHLIAKGEDVRHLAIKLLQNCKFASRRPTKGLIYGKR